MEEILCFWFTEKESSEAAGQKNREGREGGGGEGGGLKRKRGREAGRPWKSPRICGSFLHFFPSLILDKHEVAGDRGTNK